MAMIIEDTKIGDVAIMNKKRKSLILKLKKMEMKKMKKLKPVFMHGGTQIYLKKLKKAF